MITREKLEQAKGLVVEADVDAWITFVRETAGGSDPVLPLILNGGLTWISALIVTRTGRTIAVVGNYDADPLIHSGDWDEVVPYVQGIREPLLEVLEREVRSSEPRLAVNYSPDDVKADGLTHGMWLLLNDLLKGSRFEGKLTSAASICSRLRGRKTEGELNRIKDAIHQTDVIFAQVPQLAKVGVSERAVYDLIQRHIDENGFGYSWDRAGNPIVNSGPDSMIGHGIPSDSITIQSGHIFHIDLGLIVHGYSSDIQRCWYVPKSGETELPEDVERALTAVNAAISAGAEILKPGVEGWKVDEAARSTLVAHGYPEYLHALGHQVGLVAHDGGGILGPRWERYGNTPFLPVEANQVYTLELGITVPGRGYLGLEEMVRVTEDGVEWLTHRQLDMPMLA